MNTSVEIIGTYVVQPEPPTHLVEVLIRNSTGVFDVGTFTQEVADLPRSHWQVAYDEHILDASGEAIIADGFFSRGQSALWTGDVRLAFFFHHLDFSKPLKTPFGDVALPGETTRPPRLSGLKYEPP
jgi:hypothetical protein